MDKPESTLLGKIMANGKLPTPRSLALRVTQLCNKDNVTNQEVAQAIKSDPALCGRLIKVANIQVGYQTRAIVSIVDAVAVLGFNTIRQLVLGLSLMEDTRNSVCANFDYQRFWAHCLLTAITAQQLVSHKGIGSSEEVFILGLLGKVGVLGLASACPNEYGRIMSSADIAVPGTLQELERAEFNFDHTQLTEAMLADWGMPVLFQKIARAHENPAQSGCAENTRSWHLLHALHVADYFSTLCLAPQTQSRQMTPNLILIANRLGIELEALAELGNTSVREWNEWSKLCNLRPIAVPRFEELLEAVPLVPAMRDNSEALPAGSGAFYKLRILIVDDDQIVRLLLSTLLEKAGHVVTSAADGQSALELIEKFRPQAIITDWVMPHMNGVEFCRELRRNPAWRNIYVFMLTSQDGVDSLVEAFEAGANDFMNKPINPKILFARLRAAQRVVQLQEDIESDRKNLRNFSNELATMNQRLRKSEVSARAILDNSPYIVWLKDAEGRYVKINKNYSDHLQRKGISEIIGKTDLEVWPQEIAEQYMSYDASVMKSKKRERIEKTYLNGDEVRWLMMYITPVLDEHGKFFGTTGFARDITDRKQLEVDLKIAAIAFESREGIAVTDANGVIRRINRAFSEITGYAAHDTTGQTMRLISSGRHDATFYAAMWERLKATGVWQGEIWNRRKNGDIYPAYLTITAIKNEAGKVTNYVSTQHDITERKSAEHEIHGYAFYDALTGLPNRRLLYDRLDQALIGCKRSGCYNALMFLDLDNFKPLNDMYGHAVGDLLLVEVARRISGCVRQADAVARFGGDEFVAVLCDLSKDETEAKQEAGIIAEKIRTSLALPYHLEIQEGVSKNIKLTHQCLASIGVVLFNASGSDKADLLKWADGAMYGAKGSGGNRVKFHAPTA